MPAVNDGGLGNHLVGEKILINQRCVAVTKLLGEGGFSYVYLCKDISETTAGLTPSSQQSQADAASGTAGGASRASTEKPIMVLKVTSIHSRQQREIAEKEAKLLSRLSHPSIIKMFDACYRTKLPQNGSRFSKNAEGGAAAPAGPSGPPGTKERPQHMILMEFCEGGHALDVCAKLSAAGQRFDLSALIIAFGQICNAVSYLHAQRPPIVHRDLKPVNFLVKNGAYKLCDFGSAVFGHVDIRTPQARADAEEVIQKTTTQMFRAPEMVDLYMAKRLTQATDVWALGCCLYSLAFLQNCFEEGSNLAILSRNYKIPDDNPYGEGLVELLDRMLTVDYKARADMTEVILCLSAVYSGRPLPPRKKAQKAKKEEEKEEGVESEAKRNERVGTFRTDGQGIRQKKAETKKPVEAKKLNPNSAAARRRRAHDSPLPSGVSSSLDCLGFDAKFPSDFETNSQQVNEELAFSTTDNPFALNDGGDDLKGDHGNVFGSFDGSDGSVEGTANDFISFDACNVWGNSSQHDGDFTVDAEEHGEGQEVSLMDSVSQASADPAYSPYRVRSAPQPSRNFDTDSHNFSPSSSPLDSKNLGLVSMRRLNGSDDPLADRLSVSLHDDTQQEKAVKRRSSRPLNRGRLSKSQDGDLAGLSMHSDDGDIVAARASQRGRARTSRNGGVEAPQERTILEEEDASRRRSVSRTGRDATIVATKKPQRRGLASSEQVGGSSRRLGASADADAGRRRLSNERQISRRMSGEEGPERRLSNEGMAERRGSNEGGTPSTPRMKPKRRNSLRNIFPQGKTKA